jgi:hypothetical protein
MPALAVEIQLEGEADVPWGSFDLKEGIYTIRPQSKPMTITADDLVITAWELEYREKEGLALIQGDVTLAGEDFSAKGERLRADFAQGEYILEGSVSLTAGDFEAAAQTLTYRPGLIEVAGFCEIILPEGSLQGQHFQIDLETGSLLGFGPAQLTFK